MVINLFSEQFVTRKNIFSQKYLVEKSQDCSEAALQSKLSTLTRLADNSSFDLAFISFDGEGFPVISFGRLMLFSTLSVSVFKRLQTSHSPHVPGLS